MEVILERISDAGSTTALLVREMMERHPDFRDIGKRMLLVWKEGVSSMRDGKVNSLRAVENE